MILRLQNILLIVKLAYDVWRIFIEFQATETKIRRSFFVTYDVNNTSLTPRNSYLVEVEEVK